MTDTEAQTEPQRPHPHLVVTRDGAVLTITLDNPSRRNSQVPSLWAALADLAEGLDPDVRVVVLRGNGPSFSAGLDRGMLAPGGVEGEPELLGIAVDGPERAAERIEDFQRGFAAWASVPAVVVASVQGHAIGAGFQLALAADLRVVADDVQFAMRETSLGLVPDLGGTGPLVRAIGYAVALELCATGRFMGAQEAVARGLANVAVPLAELDATTADLVAALVDAPDAALRELKPLLASAATVAPGDQLRAEREAQGRLLHGLARAVGR